MSYNSWFSLVVGCQEAHPIAQVTPQQPVINLSTYAKPFRQAVLQFMNGDGHLHIKSGVARAVAIFYTMEGQTTEI
jgi:hypothetical protein